MSDNIKTVLTYRYVLVIWITITCCLAARAQTSDPSPDSLGGWPQLTDSLEVYKKARIDTRKLDEAFSYIQKTTKNGGLLVLRNGVLVYEKYFGKGSREAATNLASCGKAFTSIAIGILMAQHPELFQDGLDQKIFTPGYFPDWVFPLPDARMSEIKLGQLLSFTAGIRGNNPVYVNLKPATISPPGPDGWPGMVDKYALGLEDGKLNDTTPFTTKSLWCAPGQGYSYATASIHIASVMLRHISGLELQEFLHRYVGKPLGWGRWGFGYKGEPEVAHTPGGGGIVLRPTDVLRFGYLLLNNGKWKNQQIVPSKYVQLSSKEIKYNPHYPYSLQFNVNSTGHWSGLPRDAYWKSGSGGHCLYIVPSENLVVWKLGGRDGQYSPKDTGFPLSPSASESAGDSKEWISGVTDEDPNVRTLEMVLKSIIKK
ncbi:MAG TPA: serine hydrolase [Flavitalea sp.]|nr:serine hydrolase [Flavitalea sp.]